MKILLQPEKSRTCGAHCVAMVTGVPVDKVLELIGHKRGTRYKEIANVFKALGYPNASRRPRPFAYQKQLPDVCLIALHWKRGGAHWVVYNHGYIFCPGKGVYEYNLKNLAEQHVIAKFYMLVGDKIDLPVLSNKISHLNCEPEALKDSNFIDAVNQMAEMAFNKPKK